MLLILLTGLSCCACIQGGSGLFFLLHYCAGLFLTGMNLMTMESANFIAKVSIQRLETMDVNGFDLKKF